MSKLLAEEVAMASGDDAEVPLVLTSKSAINPFSGASMRWVFGFSRDFSANSTARLRILPHLKYLKIKLDNRNFAGA